MILTADYHTHTVYSHGKGKIEQNALYAKQSGLAEVGITDHGFAHTFFGIKVKKLPEMQNKCAAAYAETGVKTLLGVEANIISHKGKLDVKEKYYGYFDILLAGIHKYVTYTPAAMFSLFARNYFHTVFGGKPSKSLVKENTETYINVIKNNPVDIITHLNYCCYADVTEVAKAAADYGTYIEISAKKRHLTTDEWRSIVENTSARFVLSSDAHTPDRVGDFALAKKVIEEAGIPLDRIDNIDGKIPKFRFAEYKSRL